MQHKNINYRRNFSVKRQILSKLGPAGYERLLRELNSVAKEAK